MPDQSPVTVVIVGAGIAGLTLALCLARAGVRVTVLERADELREIGAGLQLSPNASSILYQLGLGSAIDATGVRPTLVRINDGVTGRPIADIPLGETMLERYRAPYVVIHRGDLQGILEHAVDHEPRVKLRLGAELLDIESAPHGVNVTTREAGETNFYRADVLVGADGVRSYVREKVMGTSPAAYSGRTAWRATFGAGDWHGSTDIRNVTGLWLGPKAHLVHYAIDAGRVINLVASLDDDWSDDGWDVPGSQQQIKAAFRDWPEQVRALIAKPIEWRKWALCGVPPNISWSRGRVVLIGDAAHAMLPFVAQGGAMAIEDARVLADILSDDDGRSIEARLEAYVTVRRPRVDRVVAMARRNGSIYHLSGLPALARNLVMRTAGPARLLDAMDWIYGWRPVEG